MSAPGLEQTPRLRPSDRVRAVMVGVVSPLLLVALAWTTTSFWGDLPDQLPSHWGQDGADAFLPPQSIIDAWGFGGLITAAVAVSVTIGAAHQWRWTPLGRGVSAVGVGAAGAVASGLFVQMLVARGKTTEQVVELGLGPSFLAVLAGLVVFTVLALVALPQGSERLTRS